MTYNSSKTGTLAKTKQLSDEKGKEKYTETWKSKVNINNINTNWRTEYSKISSRPSQELTDVSLFLSLSHMSHLSTHMDQDPQVSIEEWDH